MDSNTANQNQLHTNEYFLVCKVNETNEFTPNRTEFPISKDHLELMDDEFVVPISAQMFSTISRSPHVLGDLEVKADEEGNISVDFRPVEQPKFNSGSTEELHRLEKVDSPEGADVVYDSANNEFFLQKHVTSTRLCVFDNQGKVYSSFTLDLPVKLKEVKPDSSFYSVEGNVSSIYLQPA